MVLKCKSLLYLYTYIVTCSIYKDFPCTGLIWLCSTRHNVKFAERISNEIGKRLQILALPLQVLFCNPVKRASSNNVPLVK